MSSPPTSASMRRSGTITTNAGGYGSSLSPCAIAHQAGRMKEKPLLRVNLRVGIAQDTLLHLAHRVARQFVDDDHPLRHLEFCEPALERVQHRSLIDFRSEETKNPPTDTPPT